MKQLKNLLALSVLVVALSSCEEEICIHCFPIGETHSSPNAVEFCSTDGNARMDFQVEYIDKSYNCVQAE
jgi:hypothetical protein